MRVHLLENVDYFYFSRKSVSFGPQVLSHLLKVSLVIKAFAALSWSSLHVCHPGRVWDMDIYLYHNSFIKIFVMLILVHSTHVQLGGEPRKSYTEFKTSFLHLLPLSDISHSSHLPGAPIPSTLTWSEPKYSEPRLDPPHYDVLCTVGLPGGKAVKGKRKMEAAAAATVIAPIVTLQVYSFVPGTQSGPEESKVLHPTEGPLPSPLTRGAFLGAFSVCFHLQFQETGEAKPGDRKGKK